MKERFRVAVSRRTGGALPSRSGAPRTRESLRGTGQLTRRGGSAIRLESSLPLVFWEQYRFTSGTTGDRTVELSRRKALRTVLAGGLAGLAGCSVSTLEPTDGSAATPSRRSSATTDAAASSESPSGSALEVGTSIRPAVVVVRRDSGGGRSRAGTGWFVRENVVATNSHVVGDVDSVTCWTLDGTELDGTVTHRTEYGTRPYHDVATVRVDGSAPRTLPIGSEASLEEGRRLVQVGHPFNVGNWVIGAGEYVGEGYGEGRILSTVPHASGNSGSPVVTLDGRVVGLTTGSVPRERGFERRGEAPEPVETNVYEEYPDGTYATHNAASLLTEYLSEWSV